MRLEIEPGLPRLGMTHDGEQTKNEEVRKCLFYLFLEPIRAKSGNLRLSKYQNNFSQLQRSRVKPGSIFFTLGKNKIPVSSQA